MEEYLDMQRPAWKRMCKTEIIFAMTEEIEFYLTSMG